MAHKTPFSDDHFPESAEQMALTLGTEDLFLSNLKQK